MLCCCAQEEKVDGANLGIFITKDLEVVCQNRSHFVNEATHWQFASLRRWIDAHREGLFKALKPGRHILYGEWLNAVVRLFLFCVCQPSNVAAGTSDGHVVHSLQWPVASQNFVPPLQHSVRYTRLPDVFLAFDIFDKKHGRFLSRARRNRRLSGTGICVTPLLACKRLSGPEEILEMLESQSRFSEGHLEGVYLRIDEQEQPAAR